MTTAENKKVTNTDRLEIALNRAVNDAFQNGLTWKEISDVMERMITTTSTKKLVYPISL